MVLLVPSYNVTHPTDVGSPNLTATYFFLEPGSRGGSRPPSRGPGSRPGSRPPSRAGSEVSLDSYDGGRSSGMRRTPSFTGGRSTPGRSSVSATNGVQRSSSLRKVGDLVVGKDKHCCDFLMRDLKRSEARECFLYSIIFTSFQVLA